VAYDVLTVELRRDVRATEERQLAKEDRQRAERAARAAEEQTRIQRQLRLDAAQPYVWADVRPDAEHEHGDLLAAQPLDVASAAVKQDPRLVDGW
jgi:hypothetical protein